MNFDPTKAAWKYSPDITMEDGYIFAISRRSGLSHIVRWVADSMIMSFFLEAFDSVDNRLVSAYNAARSARF